MPKRDDLQTILILGSGPIVIGQGCEFDYSGTQACKALREEGYRLVLVNSNPATIMTDPALSDRTYIEPITPEAVRKVIIRERERGNPIDAVLPTLGGQTALNYACALHDNGDLEELGVERAWMLGDTPDDVRAARGAGVVPIGVLPNDAEAGRAALDAAGAARVLGTGELVAGLEEVLP